MKINKGLLKQMIAEEMATFNEKADPSKLPKDRFPTKLSQVDMDTAQRVAQAGDDDGQPEDDVIGVTKGTMPVSKLKPAQSTMKISNAMGMALAMLRGDMDAGGDLGGFISQDGHILDGHHRWVATAMVDPSKEVGGFVVDFPASQIIAVLNTITKGLLGITKGKEGSGSFAQFQEEPMRKQLQDFMENGVPGKFPVAPEKIVAQVKQATGIDDPAQARDALVQRFAKNLTGIKFQVPAGAPERVDMPVIDPGLKAGALQIAVNALTKGLVDVNPPFAGDDEQAAPEGSEEGEQEMQENKKDMLKRIVAEEVAKMEIEAVLDEERGSMMGDLYRRAKAGLGFGDKFWDGPNGINAKFKPMIQSFIRQNEGIVEVAEEGGMRMGNYIKPDELRPILDAADKMRDEYTELYKSEIGSDDAYYTMDKKQAARYSAVAKEMSDFYIRTLNAISKISSDKSDREYAFRAKEREDKRMRDLERERRQAAEYERDKANAAKQGSSDKKSGFDSWQSGEGDNYNYMTRMENLSKEQLAKIVKEELAQLKK